ncbi:Crp/Fnr family transcriptional regulator [Pigmentiphaga sp. H8]|uniref:Crp/Fnr family transcriptional regulator n=1 Tax=unclassified Pigmentiphaga TaxID=2626614 RepID=UPI000F5A9B1C|nr:Crp/Fnr family transcriptional regulator [Pigmentiphaga sp. H8]AZG08292.1 Crp/Fnr family transcriptional regulator [Pigmentiphaga sp. H8]
MMKVWPLVKWHAVDCTLARLAVAHSELFSGWPDEPIARLIGAADLVTLEPGDCLHRSGDEARFLYLLVTGSMRLTRPVAGDRPFIFGIHLAGDFHGLGPILARTPHINTSICKDRTTLVRIPAEILRKQIADNGRLSFPLFAALERRHLRATNLYMTATVRSIRSRVAELLRSFGARRARSHTGGEIRLSQDEIATMLGTRRQVINRTLREMAGEGAIHVQYGRITVDDPALLERMAQDEGKPVF